MEELESEAYKKAAKKVKEKKEFYSHLVTYLVMGVFFFLLNAATAWGSWWFYWPMLGWGIGVLFHYLDVFGIPAIGDVNESDWEEQAIKEEMRKMGYPVEEDQPVVDDSLDLRELEKEKPLERKPRWTDDDIV